MSITDQLPIALPASVGVDKEQIWSVCTEYRNAMWIASGIVELYLRAYSPRTTPIRFVYIIDGFGDVIKRAYHGRMSGSWDQPMVDEYTDTDDEHIIERIDEVLRAHGVDLQPYKVTDGEAKDGHTDPSQTESTE